MLSDPLRSGIAAAMHRISPPTYSFPTFRNAVDVCNACAAGAESEVCMLLDKFFHFSKWGGPPEDSEHWDEYYYGHSLPIVRKCIDEWIPEWFKSAAMYGHSHVIVSISEWCGSNNMWNDDILDIGTKVYLEKLRSPAGETEDALMACGKDWYPDGNGKQLYERPTCYHMGRFWERTCVGSGNPYWEEGYHLISKGVNPVHIRQLEGGEFVEDVNFDLGTPEDFLELIGCRLVYYVLSSASELYASDTYNKKRLIRIAKDLIELGFEFGKEEFCMLDNLLEDDDEVLLFMHKMILVFGGRSCVHALLPNYDRKRQQRSNVILFLCFYKLVLMAVRARKRVWAPGSVHVAALAANFRLKQGHKRVNTVITDYDV